MQRFEDIAEILSAEVERLRAAICQTLDANGHLADGDVCTLLLLKLALRESGAVARARAAILKTPQVSISPVSRMPR